MMEDKIKIPETEIKLWVGELFLENCVLKREIARLKAELEIKNGLLKNMSNPTKQEKEKGETKE